MAKEKIDFSNEEMKKTYPIILFLINKKTNPVKIISKKDSFAIIAKIPVTVGSIKLIPYPPNNISINTEGANALIVKL